MKKFKIEGWIKIPVDVEIFANNKKDASDYALEAIIDKIPRGSVIICQSKIKHQFVGEKETNFITIDENYEYEF